MRNLIKTSIALLMIVIMLGAVTPVSAVFPSDRGLPYPQTAFSSVKGAVTGRVTTSVNGTVGIGGAYIAIVNASNASQEYYNTTSDANGNYQISGLNATYSSVLQEGPLGQAGNYTDYLRGQSMYRIYANKSPYGEGYSKEFGIDRDNSVYTTTSVVILPPASYVTGYGPQTVWSDLGKGGAATGRVTTSINGTVGIGGAYVAVVNSLNVNEEYCNTTSDAYGNYQITGLNATYSSVLQEGPLGQAGNTTDYLHGQGMYKIYANKTPYGKGWSKEFGIDANWSTTASTSVVIFPKPARIELGAERSYVNANGVDNITITAHMYDALGNPVSDGYMINFTVGNATSNPFMQGGFPTYQGPCANGSLNTENNTANWYQGATRDNVGAASVQFGWVGDMYGGNSSTVWVYWYDSANPAASASVFANINIRFEPASTPLPGPVKNTRTGLTYQTIQGAIDDANTISGDTIQVGSGTYRENVAVDKTISLTGVDTGSGLPIVDGAGNTTIRINADGVSLQGFNVTNASTIVTTGNVIGSTDTGIFISANNTYVAGNVVNNHTFAGIYLSMANNTIVTGNTVSNDAYGIFILGSNYTTLLCNTANNDLGTGIVIFGGLHDYVVENTANNNHLIGIGLVNTNSSTIKGNTASNNTGGLLLSVSSNTTVAENIVDNNTLCGMRLGSLSFVNIVSNFVRDNGEFGICLNNSTGNVLFMNQIAGNGINAKVDGAGSNAWNSTDPVQYSYYGQTYTNYTGNYWGDYAGQDRNYDGIGDTPYVISANNIDGYPMLTNVPAVPNARYVSNTIPKTMKAGHSYSVSVTMLNSGMMPWSNASGIMLSGANDSRGDAAKFGVYGVSIPTGVTVQPGQQYTFSFTMTAPTTKGKYQPQYQMVGANNQWFGSIVTKTIKVN